MPASSLSHAQLPGTPPTDAFLDVRGRTLPVPAAARELLDEWLLDRLFALALLQERGKEQARDLRFELPAQARAAPEEQPLFVARELPAAAKGCPQPLSAPTLHAVLRKCLVPLYRERPSEAHVAAGPGIVRNSVIREWVKVHGPVQAATWAGVKEVSDRHT